jgi:hypothetical protein
LRSQVLAEFLAVIVAFLGDFGLQETAMAAAFGFCGGCQDAVDNPTSLAGK